MSRTGTTGTSSFRRSDRAFHSGGRRTSPQRFVSAFVKQRSPNALWAKSQKQPQARHSGSISSIWDYLDLKIIEIRALSRSNDLGSDFRVDDRVAMNMWRTLHAICDSTTVYPHIAPDGENGVVAVWHAGDRMVEVATDSDFHTWAVIRNGDSIKSFELDPGIKNSTLEVRRHLSELSTMVQQKNPGWREYLADY